MVAAAAACSHGADQAACDPAIDSCPAGPTRNPCTKDADCGDGKCMPDGTCQAPSTAVQDSACKNVSCAAGQFCSNGICLNSGPQCQPADPACIYIPHGAFEKPVHAWWWPWQTPAGPDDTTGHDAFRPDITDPEFSQVMSTPVVIRLHPNDPEPAVVFNTFTADQPNVVETHGVMRAIRGSDGSPIWSAPQNPWSNLQYAVDGNSSIAAGDCMGTGEVCFVTGAWDPNDVSRCNQGTGQCTTTTGHACTVDGDCYRYSHQHGGLIAFGSDGRVLWVNRDAQVWWGGPSIARLLGPTGPAQIVVGNGVYDGATGKTLCSQTTSPLEQVSGNGDGSLSIVADIDLDGIPEIVTGNQAYKLVKDASSATGYTCKALFGAGVKMPNGQPCDGTSSACSDGFPAVANFAGYGAALGLKTDDPHPQIVVVSHGTLRIHDWTGGMVMGPVPLPSNPTICSNESNAGGPPTIADFDGDGLPEVGVASQSSYAVWKPGKGFVWHSQTFDCSASTGSSVFDFEGKGQATAVYSDQCFFRVYDGKLGNVLIEEKNSSCTAYEMPIVADIDGSGRAKILVPNNNICNYTCNWPDGTVGQLQSRYIGLKALASPSDKWVNTRSVWNQHTYHVTNVNLDGTLPFPEPDSWAPGQSNSYRQNVQGQGVFSSPDLSACDVRVDMTNCRAEGAKVSAVVYNGGALKAEPGVSVDFYAVFDDGTQARIGGSVTTRALKPGDSETVTVVWKAPPQNRSTRVKAIVDEKQVIGDCHPENNAMTSADAVKCSPLG